MTISLATKSVITSKERVGAGVVAGAVEVELADEVEVEVSGPEVDIEIEVVDD
jgi:hypothetical protein